MPRHLLRGLVLVILLAGPALAWPMATNQRIDRALYPGHDSRAIVAGRIESHRVEPAESPIRELVPPLSHVVFAVDHVLLGAKIEAGASLRFSTRSFLWPATLLPLAKGARAFLIYDPRKQEGFDGNLMTVVPWSGKAPPAVKDRGEVQRLLAGELVAALGAEGGLERRRELILQMLSIVSPEQAEAAFTPLLETSDEWLRRAAVAGLAYASPKAANIERALEDLGGFIRRTPGGAMIEEREGEAKTHYEAYGLLFRYYAFLQTNWSQEERQRLVHSLPLFRLIARELEAKKPHYRWEYGISPLCLLGTADDIGLLHAYYAAHETRPNGAISERPYVRMSILRKLAELLEVEVVASLAESNVMREGEQRKLIEDALAKRTAGENAR